MVVMSMSDDCDAGSEIEKLELRRELQATAREEARTRIDHICGLMDRLETVLGDEDVGMTAESYHTLDNVQMDLLNDVTALVAELGRMQSAGSDPIFGDGASSFDVDDSPIKEPPSSPGLSGDEELELIQHDPLHLQLPSGNTVVVDVYDGSIQVAYYDGQEHAVEMRKIPLTHEDAGVFRQRDNGDETQ
jgi:hypothetical protein